MWRQWVRSLLTAVLSGTVGYGVTQDGCPLYEEDVVASRSDDELVTAARQALRRAGA